jgi:hypothetical protein
VLRRHGNNRKFGTNKLRFPHSQVFLPKVIRDYGKHPQEGSPAMSWTEKV